MAILGSPITGKDRLFGIWRSLRADACEAWQNFAVFEAWARANGYTNQPAIERDDAEPHGPENCRWVTHAERNAPLRLDHQHRLSAA